MTNNAVIASLYRDRTDLGLYVWPGYRRGYAKIPCKAPQLKRRVTFWEQLHVEPPGGWPARSWTLVGHVPGLARIPLVVLDLDTELAVEGWQEGSGAHSRGCPLAITGRGLHVYYRLDQELAARDPDRRPGQAVTQVPNAPTGVTCELLCAGKWVVLPPSVHPTGHVYTWASAWEQRLGPLEEIPVAPDWMLSALRARVREHGGGRHATRLGERFRWLEGHGGGEAAFEIAAEWAGWHAQTRTDPQVLADIARLAMMNGQSTQARYVAMRDTQFRLALALATGRATRKDLNAHLNAYVAAVTDESGRRVRSEEEARQEWLRCFVKPVAAAAYQRTGHEWLVRRTTPSAGNQPRPGVAPAAVERPGQRPSGQDTPPPRGDKERGN